MKKIILIAGPSGAGKTTISEYLTEKFNIPRVITHTTRPMRKGEKNGQSYHFETDASFANLHFFEHVTYGDYQYGSSKESLDKMWQDHDLVSLIVDIQGARSYLQQLGQQVYFLYVTTSTIKELRERLLKRGDSAETVNKRLSGSELNPLPDDLKGDAHILVNDSWTETVTRLNAIVASLKDN